MTERNSMNTEEFNLHPEEVKGNLCDFAIFLSVMRYKEAYECLLSIILDEPDFTLTEVRVEEVILNQKGRRAIRLDEIFNEVKQSEEWEECKMTIMEYARNIGIEQGMAQGIEQGLKQGIEKSIVIIIETFQELKKTMEETRDLIMEKFSLNREEADTYISKYWK